MPHVLIARDRPGALEIRKANREAHLAYIADTGVVSLAGPLLGENGEMSGSLLVLDVETRAEAEAWAARDPYALAGLFEHVEITAFRRVVG